MDYKCLKKNTIKEGDFKIIPIRESDKFEIMRMRNEQIYHLRQSQPLDEKQQEIYFSTVISKLFFLDKPDQILFSFLLNEELAGYGGLVHINWEDKNAEISFIMKTELEAFYFQKYWTAFLTLIEKVAFAELGFHKIFVYAFDLRPHLYKTLNSAGYIEDARLTQHCFFNNKFIDVLIYFKLRFLEK